MMKRSEHGFVAAEWVAAIAFLLVPTLWLVLSLSQFPERIGMAQLAANEASKQIVQSNDPPTQLNQDALDSVKTVLIDNMRLHNDTDHPRDQQFLNGISVDVKTYAADGDTPVVGIQAGGVVSVTVQLPTPMAVVDVFDSHVNTSFCCKATHREPVDNYRGF